jgi:WhiB family redox-sensing transcriptional regulator
MNDGRAITTPVKVDLQKQEGLRRRSWRDEAACRGVSVDVFYGYEGEPAVDRIAREKVAKACCAVCPVKQECFDEAIAGNEAGFWGGMSQNQRKRGKRIRKKASAKQETVVSKVVEQEEVLVRSDDLESRQGWDGSTVVIRFEVIDETDFGARWCLLKDGVVKYVTNDESDAWLMFGSWTVTL